MNKKLYTIQLVTGVTILCEAELHPNGKSYTVYNPIRPVIMDGRVVYTRMNPYSDSTETQISIKNMVSNPMPLHTAYINIYYEAVRQTEEQLKRALEAITESTQIPLNPHETLQ